MWIRKKLNLLTIVYSRCATHAVMCFVELNSIPRRASAPRCRALSAVHKGGRGATADSIRHRGWLIVVYCDPEVLGTHAVETARANPFRAILNNLWCSHTFSFVTLYLNLSQRP